jgi:NAD(P)-dependent dehydrogenase (short-subunit alcohol dehydrogenase family)
VTRRRTVLITGCSSGIGRATATHLADRGHRVFATARRIGSIEDLEKAGCTTLPLDVTDEGSMRAAVAEVTSAEGGVEVLVNNAGYGLHGPFEETSLDEIRRQFETNVFGAVALTQMVLPGMREKRFGRIVNISSMGGRITLPGGAFYHGTKHALEAISDVARFELKPFGVDVVVIEPGIIRTEFGNAAVATFEEDAGPYASYKESLRGVLSSAYEGPLGKAGVGPEAVAKTIGRAIESRRPRTRYVVPGFTRGVLLARRLLPDRAWDAAVGTTYSRPKP